MSPPLIIAVLLAAVAEATAGFGATIVTVTITAWFMDVRQVLALFLPVNLVMSVYLLVRYRALVDRRLLLRRVLPVMGLGTLVGIGVASRASAPGLKAAFGGLVAVLSAWELLRARQSGGAPRPLTARMAALALLSAGLVHGVFATGGPLAVYVLSRETADKSVFRATLAALWTALNGGLILSYALKGEITGSTLSQSAVLLVPLLLGGVVGERLHAALPIRTFRLGVFSLLGVGGLSLLVRTLLL